MTLVSAATRSRTPDRLCAEAVDLAFAAAEEAAGQDSVGEHLGVQVDGDRLVTHLFACRESAYHGWRWAVTVARAPRAKLVTVDETVLVPGPEALLAPAWVPWNERLRPGDLGVGDLLPTDADDPRLEFGYTGADETEEELTEPIALGPKAVAYELGQGRVRVLSPVGRDLAADRWDEHFGRATPMAQAAPAHCTSCGFLVKVGGPLGQAFGVCANEYSPADGRMVSLAYGCGGHSEAAVMPAATPAAELSLDEYRIETVRIRPVESSVDEDTLQPGEDQLGHS
ncbi:DUF3027 domain-containing protein [Embleya sp. NPDC050154]|uniref:DUF3027 domain-containing protein n=1 Tax=unclassified Embleya TaxID=2699296 RepID=UPI003790D46F|nr:DUF3027 domain-containing protein [Embleya sp. NBC_00888]